MAEPDKNLQFPIPNSVLEPYIKQAISSAIVGALGDGAALVAGAVQSVLATKVDADGKVNQYDSYNKHLLIEVLARQKITEVARQTINEMAEQMRPKLKAEIEKQLRSKHSDIAKALIDGMVTSLASSWSVSVKFADK